MSRHNSKSGLFLMEMIIAILFFSICSAVCIKVFAGAAAMADESRTLNKAVVQAANAAELYKAADGALDELARLMDETGGGQVRIEAIDDESLTAAYGDMIITLEKKSSGVAEISVEASDDTGIIYSLQVRA